MSEPLEQTFARVLAQYLSSKNELLEELRADGLSPIFLRNPKPRSREGVLSSGTSYWYHGKGIRFETADGAVLEWDRGPGEREDAVDPWRLYEYARTTMGDPLPELESVRDLLVQAVLQGRMCQLGGDQFAVAADDDRAGSDEDTTSGSPHG